METNLKFNSQICTTRSQSERLLALGLKKGTADCFWLSNTSSITGKTHCRIIVGEFEEDNRCVPAWSLHRLIEMLPKEIEHPVWFGKKKMEEIGWWELRIDSMGKEYPWAVVYHREDSAPLALEYATELIDALYAMILQLKEEGVGINTNPGIDFDN